MGDYYARFCGGRRVKLPPATRPDHLLAWSVGGEVAVDQVGDRPGAAVVLGQAGPPRPRLAWHQAMVTHDGADQLETGRDAAAAQLGMHTAVAVGLVGVGEDLHHQRRQLLPPARGRRHFSTFPVEEAGRGHGKPPTHVLHGVGVLHRINLAGFDELILLGYRGSRAKYAAAFFRNSFSIFSSRTSRSASRSRARSLTSSAGSSSAWSRRKAATQFPRVPSLILSSRATWAIGREFRMTAFTASSLNSGENFRRFRGTCPHFLAE